MVALRLLKFTFVLTAFSYVAIGGLSVDKLIKVDCMETHFAESEIFSEPEFPGEEALVRQREKLTHRPFKIGVMAPEVCAASSEKKKMIQVKKKHPFKSHESNKKASHPGSLLKEDIVFKKSTLNPNIVLS
ncbi:uncharacterized protein MELLADRAFT_101262 [Melampsora larici-populina 98AG31]|uniref:Uncharacterized protein n=1 Tax=Melampsora larici-populina (strain 98AG31 / pathotype 3-4-7) TaxID=747676 RepID=F4R458_MELLP|nr:uncharacterized protein MELLADRAFT_101262 [Melampsora larici-populina 98AG31]EGG12746.1 hypothetical protein MELLADRAFT_101262 [Melampsora larici-populina 98AG31]